MKEFKEVENEQENKKNARVTQTKEKSNGRFTL